jgi:osmotically-inducible protein OsmY
VPEPQYERERIRQALATDPRVGEPELSVDIVAGRVLVQGSAPTSEVRVAVEEVVAEVAPGLAVDNQVTVAAAHEPSGEEAIG